MSIRVIFLTLTATVNPLTILLPHSHYNIIYCDGYTALFKVLILLLVRCTGVMMIHWKSHSGLDSSLPRALTTQFLLGGLKMACFPQHPTLIYYPDKCNT